LAELHVKTVKYFRSIERVQEEVERTHAEFRLAKNSGSGANQQMSSME
jgi:glucosamine-6-phosphate deaminase